MFFAEEFSIRPASVHVTGGHSVIPAGNWQELMDQKSVVRLCRRAWLTVNIDRARHQFSISYLKNKESIRLECIAAAREDVVEIFLGLTIVDGPGQRADDIEGSVI